MTRPPDRLMRTTDAARVATAIKTIAPGSNAGNSLRSRALRRAILGGLRASGIFAIVFNGDDTDTARPSVMWCLWVGAAVPANGYDYDPRYSATL